MMSAKKLYKGVFDPLGERQRFFVGTSDDSVVLEINPHYTDHRFKKPRTIFCTEPSTLEDDGFGNLYAPGCHYDYSDRIYEWDYDKAKQAENAADEDGHKHKTAKWLRAYLSHLYGKDVELVHVIAGVNHSNGYPYCVFGTRDV